MKRDQDNSVCTVCGVEARTKSVQFGRIVSYIVGMNSTTITGTMCKSCINRAFWQTTPVTLLLGWWSLMGALATPIILIHNTVRYVLCLGLRPVPPGAHLPELTEEVVRSLAQHDDRIRASLDPECNLQEVVTHLAEELNVNRGELVLYIQYRHGECLMAEHDL